MKIQTLFTDLSGKVNFPNQYKTKNPKPKIVKLKKNKYGTDTPASLFTGGYAVAVDSGGDGGGDGGGGE
jgi:hypothetical protein